MNAIEFLKEKGIIKDGFSDFIISYEDGRTISVVDIMKEYVDSKTIRHAPIKEAEEGEQEFSEAVKPLMKYLAEVHHPHISVVVNSSRAEIMEGVRMLHTDEFI